MEMKNTYNRGYAAHLRNNDDRTAIMPDNFDLDDDYAAPRSYTALVGNICGYAILPTRKIRVWVDHEATGTGTTGTGDTVVRSYRPRA
jgi:hypothetical protein